MKDLIPRDSFKSCELRICPCNEDLKGFSRNSLLTPKVSTCFLFLFLFCFKGTGGRGTSAKSADYIAEKITSQYGCFTSFSGRYVTKSWTLNLDKLNTCDGRENYGMNSVLGQINSKPSTYTSKLISIKLFNVFCYEFQLSESLFHCGCRENLPRLFLPHSLRKV